ncbi:N-acetyltransferase family protein [Shewanella sp.]|uniref:GNAT family N-acetyltransferase n=1 Tax=Shewanella sp. TaxID=50422 RepID=UPI0035672459
MIRPATQNDVCALLALEQRHGRDELDSDNPSLEAQLFDQSDFIKLIDNELLLLALHDDTIVGYAIVVGETFYRGIPFYRRLFSRARRVAQESNIRCASFGCYGPVWVDPKYRGKGVFRPLVSEVISLAARRYESLFTFIAEENEHSLNAHVQGAKMQVVDFFEDDQRGFYLLFKSC